MGMYKNIQDILNVLWYDEELLRLLVYMPENILTNTPDPLDSSLENILEKSIEEQWKIRNEVIMLTPKDDDLVENRKCRLFVYLGDREPNRGNYHIATQELVVDILCHSDFENGDMRTTRIGDRLNELFAMERVTGFGKTDYVRGTIISRTPSQYVGYRHIYSFGGMKK
jgi:hypothetical protein